MADDLDSQINYLDSADLTDQIKELKEEVARLSAQNAPRSVAIGSAMGYAARPIVDVVEASDSTALISAVRRAGNTLINNPSLTVEQAENLRAIIAGMGTAASVKLLGPTIGDEAAAALGGGIAAHVIRKIIRG